MGISVRSSVSRLCIEGMTYIQSFVKRGSQILL